MHGDRLIQLMNKLNSVFKTAIPKPKHLKAFYTQNRTHLITIHLKYKLLLRIYSLPQTNPN